MIDQVECDQNRSLSPQLRQELIGSERCIPKSKVTQTKPPSKRSRDVEAVNLSKQTSNRSERPYAARYTVVISFLQCPSLHKLFACQVVLSEHTARSIKTRQQTATKEQ